MAAIRFFHDKIENAKYRLPDNSELSVELEKRTLGGTDRTWSKDEFDRILVISLGADLEKYAVSVRKEARHGN